MWLVGNKRPPLDVYLTLGGFAAIQNGRVAHTHDNETQTDSNEALKRWLISISFQGAIRIFLSGGICRPFLASVPNGLSGTEAELAWQAAAAARTGLSKDCIVWKESPDIGAVRLAAALEDTVFHQLQGLTRIPRRNISIASIQPAWSTWLNTSLALDQASTCVILQEIDSVTILAGDGSGFELATSLQGALDPITTRAAVDRLLLVTECVKNEPGRARIGLRESASSVKTENALSLLLEKIH